MFHKPLNLKSMVSTFYISNMVCDRCLRVVREQFVNAGILPVSITPGEVTVQEGPVPEEQKEQIKSALQENGFAMLEDTKEQLIEKVKNEIIKRIHHSKRLDLKLNWSDLLAEKMQLEYHYLSNLFSSHEGVTIEQYIIRQKVERVKELLFYDEQSLGQIAILLGYSSIQHISTQFKKVTGLTPSQFKKQTAIELSRKPLDLVSR